MQEENRFEKYNSDVQYLWMLIVANSLSSGIHTFCTAIENADLAVEAFRNRFPPPQIMQFPPKTTVAEEDQASEVWRNALVIDGLYPQEKERPAMPITTKAD